MNICLLDIAGNCFCLYKRETNILYALEQGAGNIEAYGMLRKEIIAICTVVHTRTHTHMLTNTLMHTHSLSHIHTISHRHSNVDIHSRFPTYTLSHSPTHTLKYTHAHMCMNTQVYNTLTFTLAHGHTST